MTHIVASPCAILPTMPPPQEAAAGMFTKVDRYKIHVSQLATGPVETLAKEIFARTGTSIGGPDEAILHVFDEILEPSDFVGLLRKAGSLEGWRLQEVVQTIEVEPFVLFSLTVYVGHEHSLPSMSEVVGFAPYDFLPRTRRAPVCAWAIRTKPEHSLDGKDGEAERRANLAAIPVNLSTQAFDRMWKRSQELRAELSGADSPAARARVTLAVPGRFCGSEARGDSTVTTGATLQGPS